MSAALMSALCRQLASNLELRCWKTRVMFRSGRKSRLGASIALMTLALSLLAPRAATQTTVDVPTRFQLFANCEPMNLVVWMSPKAKEIGLTETSVRAAVESRLRTARLYDAKSIFSLATTVDVQEKAFTVRVEYLKIFQDTLTDKYGHAISWFDGAIGTHGGDPSFILNSIPNYVDTFLVEYLRVNEEACAKR